MRGAFAQRFGRSLHLEVSCFGVREVGLAEADVLAIEGRAHPFIACVDGEVESVLELRAPISIHLGALKDEAVVPAQLLLWGVGWSGRLP